MKKTLSSMALCGILVGFSANASATELQSNQGGVDLDSLINQEASGSFVIDDTKKSENNFSMLSSTSKASDGVKAGGGIFMVDYGFDQHTSIYKHSKKEHKSSASNSHSTIHSPWQQKGTTAYATIKSSLYGNKANWNVR